MAGSIAKLVVALGADVASFETDMARATKNQKARMKQMEQNAAVVGRAMATAFTAVAASLTAMVVKTTKTADEMAKMASRLGTSTEALSELSHVADLSGVKFNQLTIGMQRMERRIAEVAALGKGTAKDALDELGLSAEKLAKLPVDKQFEAVAEELSKVEDQSQKVRLAFKLFDSEGVALIQTMGDGAAGIQAMREEARQLGIVIGTDLAANSELFNDNITRMTAGLTGVSNNITAGILPALIGVQEHFLAGGTSMDSFRRIGEQLGEVILYLVRAFTLLWGLLKTVAAALLGLVVTVQAAFDAMLVPIEAMIGGIARATAALKSGDFSGAWQAIKNIGVEAAEGLSDAMDDLNRGIDEVSGSTVYYEEAWKSAAQVTTKTAKDVDKLEGAVADLEDATMGAGEAAETAKERTKRLNEEYQDMVDATDMAFDSLEYLVDELEAADEEAADFEQAVQDLIDRLFPASAAMRDLDFETEMLSRAFASGVLNVFEYSAAMQALMVEFAQAQAGVKDTKKELDLFATAVDEGARIIERAFSQMWDDIFSGADGAFDGIADAFKSLLANLVHQATTQKIVLNIQNGLQGTGTGPNGGINWQSLLGDSIALAGTLIGSELGGGGKWASMGSAFGSLVGEAAFSALFPAAFQALGAFAGPIGIAVGAILGGLLGGLFDKQRPSVLQVSGFDTTGLSGSDEDTLISTAFGDTFLRSRRVDAAAITEFADGLKEFDAAIASFLTSEQISEVSAALKAWGVQITGETLSTQQILESRFAVILSTFDQNIQDFARAGGDLTDQVGRLQVGLAAADLMEAAPDLFSGKTLDDFLAIVVGFQDGTETIGEAFQEVLQLLESVAGSIEVLKSFAQSDLASDYATMLEMANETLTEKLSRLGRDLFDAIANFDGSPEQLASIAQRVGDIRAGELLLLQQIDDIQKGITANLEKLKNEILGIGQEALSGQELFNQAEALLAEVLSAGTAEDVARLVSDFESLIRQIAPEDQASMQAQILALIDSVQTASDTRLGELKQAAIDSAESIRAMVDNFTTQVGEPLDFIAASNDRIAEATEMAVTMAITKDEFKTESEADRRSMESVMDEGLGDIESAVAGIGPLVASAIRQGLSGLDVNVTVNTPTRLVTE